MHVRIQVLETAGDGPSFCAEQPGEVKAREQQAARLVASAWVFVERQDRPVREHGDIRVAARFFGDHAAGGPCPAAVAASACGAALPGRVVMATALAVLAPVRGACS